MGVAATRSLTQGLGQTDGWWWAHQVLPQPAHQRPCSCRYTDCYAPGRYTKAALGSDVDIIRLCQYYAPGNVMFITKITTTQCECSFCHYCLFSPRTARLVEFVRFD